jgi:hypothetical protein
MQQMMIAVDLDLGQTWSTSSSIVVVIIIHYNQKRQWIML